MKTIYIAMAVVLCASFQAKALSIPESPTSQMYLDVGAAAEVNASSANAFDGIIKLSNCSGSLVRFDDTPATAPGLLLTNGHCYKMGAAQSYEANVPSVRGVAFLSRDLNSTVGQTRTNTLLYSSMTGTDVSLYQLDLTYQQIYAQFSVVPITLNRAHATPGTPINVVSGYWRRNLQCRVDTIVSKLKEGVWTMNESIRYTPECKVIHGTSGSPIISGVDGTVIGINNTVYENGTPCTEDNPCEVNPDGTVAVYKDRGYGQKTSDLYTCRNGSGQFDVTAPGCKLYH